MKKSLGFVLAVLLLLCLFGCSSTRKTIKEETSVTASQKETTHSESDKTAASTTYTEEKTNTNVVVDFTKVEYTDGSDELLTEYPAPEKVPENFKGSQCKPPDNKNGIKSITSGRITINGNASNKQETQAKTTENSRESNKKSAESQETEQKQEQKSPTFGYFAPVRATVVLLLVIAAVVLWWKSRKG